MGTDFSTARKARFEVGDQVTVVGLLLHQGEQGRVVEITEGFDLIYRYHVRFSNGLMETFFGLELASIASYEKCA